MTWSGSDSAPCHQVCGKCTEPVGAGVVFAGDAGEAGLRVGCGGVVEHFDFRLGGLPGGGDAFEHPGAGEVKAVEVREFAVGGVGAADGCDREGNTKGRQSAFEPIREVFGRHDAAHEVGFGEGGGEEVVAGGFVPEG